MNATTQGKPARWTRMQLKNPPQILEEDSRPVPRQPSQLRPLRHCVGRVERIRICLVREPHKKQQTEGSRKQ